MSLTTEELRVLKGFLQTHPVIELILDPTSLQLWMQSNGSEDFFGLDDSPPEEKDVFFLFNAMNALSFAEKNKFFSIEDVTKWLADFANKIAKGEDIIVQRLGENNTERRIRLKLIYNGGIDLLVRLGLIDRSFTGIVTSLIERDFEAFVQLTYLLTADGVLKEESIDRITCEFSGAVRWQFLKLSAAPTVEEIISAIS